MPLQNIAKEDEIINWLIVIQPEVFDLNLENRIDDIIAVFNENLNWWSNILSSTLNMGTFYELMNSLWKDVLISKEIESLKNFEDLK